MNGNWQLAIVLLTVLAGGVTSAVFAFVRGMGKATDEMGEKLDALGQRVTRLEVETHGYEREVRRIELLIREQHGELVNETRQLVARFDEWMRHCAKMHGMQFPPSG